jgi:integrase
MGLPTICTPSAMSHHIEQCRNVWFATLKVPVALRQTLGRTKFKQTLGTSDKRRAVILAAPVVANWQAILRQAAGEGDAVQREAMKWREVIKTDSTGEHRDTMVSLMADRANEIEEREGEEAALHFADVATGRRTPSGLHVAAWEASIAHLAAKTRDQMKKDVGLLVSRFTTLEAITSSEVRRWVDQLANEGAGPASIKRLLSFWRSYWRYLVSVDAVPLERQPFTSVTIRSLPRTSKKGWIAFAPNDVVALWQEAHKRGDEVLGDLIVLGAFTGARIEELCSMKLKDVGDASLRITDAKTEAGIREVPIHSALKETMERLKKDAADDYLLPGLTFNMYEDRSNAIGKRFGRLKTALGFGSQHVFHSIRKTLVTMLENAGVSENLAADIVGHEKPRITYGLYSGGASLATKAEALEKVRYGVLMS